MRLTVDGLQFTQRLTLRLDPRVTISDDDLALLTSLSTEMYERAVAVRSAYEEARALVAELEAAGNAEAKAAVEALAPPPLTGYARRYSRYFGPSGPPNLRGASDALMRAAVAMQAAEVAPTMRQIAACHAAREQAEDVMRRWNALKASIHGG